MTRGRFNDLTGRRFGRLEVVDRAQNRNKHVYWRCRCDCGKDVEVRGDALTRGPTVSCGCYHDDIVTKHGMWQTPIYRIWRSMLGRCENPNAHAYELYGGRGIKICDAWHDFQTFYDDIGKRPADNYSLDRINNDGDYCPENCRWATWKQQSRNRSNNRIIELDGERRCISEWASITGINHGTLTQRLNRGWTARQTLTMPVDLGNRWKRK